MDIAHMLVPRHSVASEAEVKEVLEKYDITVDKLPLIFLEDPALANIEARPGDVIKIERNSPVTKKVEPYYRYVIE